MGRNEAVAASNGLLLSPRPAWFRGVTPERLCRSPHRCGRPRRSRSAGTLCRARVLHVLTLTAHNLSWLQGVPPEDDLCAHGGFSMEIDGASLIDARDQSFALNVAALHLLRSVERDHVIGQSAGQQLVPCCGHSVWLVEDREEVRNVGCDFGLDWSVVHRDDMVALSLDDDRTVELPRKEWARAILAFAEAVQAFYAASAPKRPPQDALDREGYAAFWVEWERRRAAVERAA
jgi:hypothetical protein